jgi:hypothetical protein
LTPPIQIPADVHDWLSGVFSGCNSRVSDVLTAVPTMHETPLDMSFIEHFLTVSAPHRFPESEWTVSIDTHYLGGGRHWSDFPHMPPKWEIADIGLLVIFRRAGRLLRSKVVLLQSKRLYADELEWEEDSPLDYMRGFGRLLHTNDEWAEIAAPRRFGFTHASQYKALVRGVGQYDRIRQYESERHVPVYYLLYNPRQIPSDSYVPISAATDGGNGRADNSIGCRIVPASRIRNILDGRPEGAAPSYGDITMIGAPLNGNSTGGWRLEHFVVDLVLNCLEGYVAESPSDGGLNYIFNRRTGPISAALAITLDAP